MRRLLITCIFFGAVECQVGNERLVCLGSEFVTRLVSTLLDRNRENFARNEPNRVGNREENIALFLLKNPRVYNLSNTLLHGPVTVDCVSDPKFVKIRLGISNLEYVFIYDYIFPGHLTYGKVVITSDYFGQIFYLEAPSEPKSTERTLLKDIEFYRSDDFKISFTGIGPVTRVLSSVLWAAYRLTPQVPLQLYKILAIRVIQNYIDNNPLPI